MNLLRRDIIKMVLGKKHSPCLKCIVNSMCNQTCEEMEFYIEQSLKYGKKYHFYHDLKEVGSWLRRSQTDGILGEVQIGCRQFSYINFKGGVKQFYRQPTFLFRNGLIEDISYNTNVKNWRPDYENNILYYYRTHSNRYIIYIGLTEDVWPGFGVRLNNLYGRHWNLI